MIVSKCGNHNCRCAWETVTSETLAPTVIASAGSKIKTDAIAYTANGKFIINAKSES